MATISEANQQSSRPADQGQPNGRLTPLVQQLYRVLTDGAPRLRWQIRRGYQYRDPKTKKPIFSSFTDQWRPARDLYPDDSTVDRSASWHVLQQHVLGKFDIAIQSPSWSSLVVLDIDRPTLGAAAGDEDAELLADFRRDEVLADVWRAYRFTADRQPVVLFTPGRGYHVYLPHCRDAARAAHQHPWPVAWLRHLHEHHLNQAGRGLRAGELELFPSGVPLRAPCGLGMALAVPRNPDDPDNLQLELRYGEWAQRVDPATKRTALTFRRHDVPGLVAEFLQRLEATRRPAEDWLDAVALDAPPAAWGRKYGPWGDRTDAGGTDAIRSYQHIVEKPRGGGAARPRLPALPAPSSNAPAGGAVSFDEKVSTDGAVAARPKGAGKLRYGRDFRLHVARLLTYGLERKGDRHDAVLKLGFHLAVCCRLDDDTTQSEFRKWLEQHEHVSGTRDRKKKAFFAESMAELKHYVKKHLPRGRRPAPSGAPAGSARAALARLQAADEAIVAELPDQVRAAALAILQLLATYSDESGRVAAAVTLSARALERLAGQRRVVVDGTRRRATAVALEELQRLGVLAVHANYSVGHHGRQYTCWYQFGSGNLPPRDKELGAILATRTVEEGVLAIVGGEPRQLPVARFVSLRAGLSGALQTWWHRMYARRAWLPGDFFEADQRQALGGPFRDRWTPKPKAQPTPDAPAPSPAPLPPPPSSVRRHPGDTDEMYSLRLRITEAEARGDMAVAREALQHLVALVRAMVRPRQPN